MEVIDPKHLELINQAFAKLSENGPYEIRTTSLSFGKLKEKLRPVFVECFTRYDQTITKFQWLPEYEEVLDWMVDNQGRGLFMYGDCGRGKTRIILGVLRPMLLVLGKPLPGYHASLLTSRNLSSDGWNYEKYRTWKISYIDELGTEKAVNDYGEKFEAFNEIINVAEQNLDLMIISSNLSPELFLQRYGDRSMDRIRRLCKPIEFKGESLRP
jgi:DNA replication protein DnaC